MLILRFRFQLFLVVAVALCLGCGERQAEQAETTGDLSQSTSNEPEKDLIADFHLSTDCGASPLSVSFIDQSEGDIDSYHWVFDDGSPPSTERIPPAREYNYIRVYRVSLTVTSGNRSDTRTKPVQVVPRLTPPENLQATKVKRSLSVCGSPADPQTYRLSWSAVPNAEEYEVRMAVPEGRCEDEHHLARVNTTSVKANIVRCPRCPEEPWRFTVTSINSNCAEMRSEPSTPFVIDPSDTPEQQLADFQIAYVELRAGLADAADVENWNEVTEIAEDLSQLRTRVVDFLYTHDDLQHNTRRKAEMIQGELADFVEAWTTLTGSTTLLKLRIEESDDLTQLSLVDASGQPLLTQTPSDDRRINWVTLLANREYFLTWTGNASVRVFTKIGISESEECKLDQQFGMLQLAMETCSALATRCNLYVQTLRGWTQVRGLMDLEAIEI